MQIYTFCVFSEGKWVSKFQPKTPSPLTGYTGPKPVFKAKKREDSIYKEMVQRKWVLSDCYERYLADLDKKTEGFMNDIILEFESEGDVMEVDTCDMLDNAFSSASDTQDHAIPSQQGNTNVHSDTQEDGIHAPNGELLSALTELLDQFLETQTESEEVTVSVHKRKRDIDCLEPVQTPSKGDTDRPVKKLRVKGVLVQS